MAKLQLALDLITFENALKLVERVADSIDILEAGTPFVIRYGLEAVRRIRAAFPALEILCDGKIMDAGAYETGEMLEAGADYVTVLGATDDQTIVECVREAKRFDGRVVVDMICVDDLAARVAQVENLGAHIIAVHTGIDQQRQGRTPLKDLRVVKAAARTAKVAVAGGITIDTIEDYLKNAPDIVIVGSGILSQPDPVQAAKILSQRIRG